MVFQTAGKTSYLLQCARGTGAIGVLSAVRSFKQNAQYLD
jgi:hypothetical protein